MKRSHIILSVGGGLVMTGFSLMELISNVLFPLGTPPYMLGVPERYLVLLSLSPKFILGGITLLLVGAVIFFLGRRKTVLHDLL